MLPRKVARVRTIPLSKGRAIATLTRSGTNLAGGTLSRVPFLFILEYSIDMGNHVNDSIIHKLESILDADQNAIKRFKSGHITTQELNDSTKKHILTLKEIIAEIGFPTISNTSKNAYKAAVMTILHSGDLDLLNESINSLEVAPAGSIERRDIGYMIDKAQILKNMPQIYGTQYKVDRAGKISFIPILEEENIDARRRELDMEPWAEYKKQVELALRSST